MVSIPFSCINYFRELTERLRSQGSNELFLCILNATTDGFQKHQCNGVSYRYPKAQLDLRPSFYATLGYSLHSGYAYCLGSPAGSHLCLILIIAQLNFLPAEIGRIGNVIARLADIQENKE